MNGLSVGLDPGFPCERVIDCNLPLKKRIASTLSGMGKRKDRRDASATEKD
jgi:hypothetical protein